jgi:hypothetical protein
LLNGIVSNVTRSNRRQINDARTAPRGARSGHHHVEQP